jgi:hypothetical protein
VIGDVNRALRDVLTPLVPAGCAVRFGANETSHPEPGDATLTFFLAEVHEDEKAGDTEWSDIRDADGRVIARRPPVRRFDLHYLVTAATTDADLEGLLLDAVLAAVDPGKRLPATVLGEAFAERPVMLRLGDGVPGPLTRTTLRVIVNAPLVLPPVTDVAAPADNIRLGVAPPGRPPRPPSPTRPGPRRWRGAAIEEDDDAVRGEEE